MTIGGTATAEAVLRTRTSFSKASQPETPVNFDVPENACDCHTHIHADPQQFPFFAARIYTPELASPEEMSALHRMLRIKRVRRDGIIMPALVVPNPAILVGGPSELADVDGEFAEALLAPLWQASTRAGLDCGQYEIGGMSAATPTRTADMSAKDQKRTSARQKINRLYPQKRHVHCTCRCLLRAKSGHCRHGVRLSLKRVHSSAQTQRLLWAINKFIDFLLGGHVPLIGLRSNSLRERTGRSCLLNFGGIPAIHQRS